MNETRGEAVETTKSVGESKDSEESKREYPKVAQVPCIWYPITFRKKSVPMSALFDLGSENNAVHPTFAQGLGLPIRIPDVEAQKIDGIMLDTFGMVVATFSVTDKAN